MRANRAKFLHMPLAGFGAMAADPLDLNGTSTDSNRADFLYAWRLETFKSLLDFWTLRPSHASNALRELRQFPLYGGHTRAPCTTKPDQAKRAEFLHMSRFDLSKTIIYL